MAKVIFRSESFRRQEQIDEVIQVIGTDSRNAS